MKSLIFADVHLKGTPDGEETLRDFVAFLRGIDPKEFDRIVILGDLFDFWFEYRHVIFSEYFEVLRGFAELRDAGMEMHLVCGNHDFWAGRFLRDTLGMTIHWAPFACTWGEKRVLFVHGDGVNPKDVAYRLYKRVARFPLVVGLFRLLHPDWAMALARRVSHGSRTLLAPRNPSQSGEVYATERYARRLLDGDEVDVVICAHSHFAVMKEWETASGIKSYINTGDWMRHRCYVLYDDGGFLPMVWGREGSGLPARRERLESEEAAGPGAVAEEIASDEAAQPRQDGKDQPEQLESLLSDE